MICQEDGELEPEALLHGRLRIATDRRLALRYHRARGRSIRAKVKAKRSAEAKTSSARFEAKLVGFAPVVMLLLMSLSSEIHREFFMTPAGWACLAVGAALDIVGFLVLKQISNIRYD